MQKTFATKTGDKANVRTASGSGYASGGNSTVDGSQMKLYYLSASENPVISFIKDGE